MGAQGANAAQEWCGRDPKPPTLIPSDMLFLVTPG